MQNELTENRDNVAIVPHRSGLFSKELFLIIVVLSIAVLIWVVVWKKAGQEQNDVKPVYQIEKRVKELEVVFLDVGQGDSIFIRTPNGHTALIDAGSGKNLYSAFDAGEHAIIPYLKNRGFQKINSLVLTHPHADHFGGMASILNMMDVGEFVDPGMDHSVPSYYSILETIQKRGISYREVQAPDKLDWDPDVLIQILWPEKGFLTENPNDVSIVIRLVYGDVVYLLAGDIETDVEGVLNLYGTQLRTTILKVPHHGSDTSSSRSFLEYTIPRLAVISVGFNNRFDHPKDDIVTRYEKLKIPIIRTDRAGTIRTITDGKVVQVIPELGDPFDIFPFPNIPPLEAP